MSSLKWERTNRLRLAMAGAFAACAFSSAGGAVADIQRKPRRSLRRRDDYRCYQRHAAVQRRRQGSSDASSGRRPLLPRTGHD